MSVSRISFLGATTTTALFFQILLIALVTVTMESCSSSAPKATPMLPSSSTKVQPQKTFAPEGWNDVTSQSKSPDVILWLVNKEYTSTIFIKELHTNESSAAALAKEELCVLGNISLRMKLADENLHRLVTRMPSLFGEKQNICSYVYSENGLLRRVMVFRKHGKVYESELIQEKSTAEFDTATDSQKESIALFLN